MPDYLQWGIEIIQAIQSYRTPLLDALFQGITFLGDERFYLIAFPLVLWCIDWRLGAVLGIMTLLTAYVNLELKEIIQQPRPPEFVPGIGIISAEGYGLPSGHAQISLVFWGVLAHHLRQKPAWLAAGVITFLIGFSRIYLGVHFPTDVFAGWALGLALLLGWIAACKKIDTAPDTIGSPALAAIFIVLPITFVLLDPSESVSAVLGALAGSGIGFLMMRRHIPQLKERSTGKKALRFVVGIAGLVVIYLGLKQIFPEATAGGFDNLWRFLRYFTCGLWIVWGAPQVFQRLKLW